MTPKLLFLRLFSALTGFLVTLLALEIHLRFLPVNEGLHTMPVDERHPILRFEPNRTSVWSRNWNFSLRNAVRTNNYGFISDIAYAPSVHTPMLAIIGDSYVEAAMIPWDQTGAARLAKALDAKGRVYAFGASGSALSQYLAYAEYVNQTFRPYGLVIVVTGNDYDESLLKYKAAPGFHYFTRDKDGHPVLTRVDSEVGTATAVSRKSALAMYMVTNLRLPSRLRTMGAARGPLVGNTWADVNPVRVRDSEWAVDSFFALLPSMSGVLPSQVLLVVDGIRPSLYTEGGMKLAEGSFEDILRRYFMGQARSKGYEVIDLQDAFRQRYAWHGHTFEFPDDLHWNALGHEVFAATVVASSLFRRVVASR